MLRLIALISPLALAACVGNPVAPSIEQTVFAPSLGVDLEASTRTPSGLYIRDIVVGTGVVAGAGSKLNVHYVGALPGGFVFDRNDAGQDTPLAFTLGAGAVVKGWDEGLVGMRVGGRRQLIIPPKLAYGDRAAGSIPPNSILVFTVDLVSTD
jgi:FKBP-type peptidyl-prolyl cis-trans isomerase